MDFAFLTFIRPKSNSHSSDKKINQSNLTTVCLSSQLIAAAPCNQRQKSTYTVSCEEYESEKRGQRLSSLRG